MTQEVQRCTTMIFAVAAATCSMMLTGMSAAVAGTHPAAGARAALTGTWGAAKEVPGTAALNQGGFALVHSVSCGSAGNCSAVGDYTDSSGDTRAFVASETNGTWHTAEEVPGTAALGTQASIGSVSCPSAGNCSAGGNYQESSGPSQAFVVRETNGTWNTAEEVPGIAGLNQGGNAGINSISCESAGNCSAGGTYADSSGSEQAFVVNETNGTWHTAKQVPGTAALNQGGTAQLTSVSCASAGDCSAGGNYQDGSGNTQVFVASETNGTWHTAREVPGIAALNQGKNAEITSVSCAPAGQCSAGGYYTDNNFNMQAFIANQT